MINLYPDQAALIQQAKDKIRAGCRSLLISSPTGSGKTCMASSIVEGAYRKEKICFFIVPRRDLLKQTSNTLREFGIPHSFIAAGYQCDTRARVFVCTSGTLVNRLHVVPDVAIFDETHFGGDGLDKIIQFYKANGSVVIGLSATPWKSSGKGLGCWYDDMICGKGIAWLIANKRLSEFRAFAPSHLNLSGIKKVAGDYAKGQLAEFMEGEKVLIGNAVKHYKTHAAGKLNVAYCVSRAHSEMVAQSFRDEGVVAKHIDGETPDDERVRIIKAFAKREIMCLTNCELLVFGFDLSSASGMNVTVESLSDLRPTMSLALQMQKWGRALRYKEYPALIFDHSNNIQEHMMPDADREWTLEDREVRGRGSSEKSIQVRECEQCHFCHKPATACPNCGNVYEIQSREIEEVDGELAEIQAVAEKKSKRIEVGKARTLDDLRRIATERGYKQGWIWNQARVKGINRQ